MRVARCGGELRIRHLGSWHQDVDDIDEDGKVELDEVEFDHDHDSDESEPYCTACGILGSSESLRAHGLSNDWYEYL